MKVDANLPAFTAGSVFRKALLPQLRHLENEDAAKLSVVAERTATTSFSYRPDERCLRCAPFAVPRWLVFSGSIRATRQQAR